MAWAVLLASLAMLAWFQQGDIRNFARFSEITDSRRRRRNFLRWAAKGCAIYLGIPLAGLALIGRLDALWNFPPEFWALAAPVPLVQPGDFGPFAIGAAIGLIIVFVALLVRGRRPARPSKPLKIEPLMARNRAEMLALLPLIFNAAISEEIFLRLYIPLLFVLAGIDAMLAFVAAALIFGALHRYQGWLGVIVTTVLGAVFTLAYLAGEGLWLPMALHLGINANSLLFRPALQRRFQRQAD